MLIKSGVKPAFSFSLILNLLIIKENLLGGGKLKDSKSNNYK